MKIEESVEDKTALQIVKIIRHFVEDVVATPGDRDIEVFLGNAVAYVTGSAPPLEKSEDERKVTDLENKLRLLKLQQESQVGELLRELKEVQSKVSENSVGTIIADHYSTLFMAFVAHPTSPSLLSYSCLKQLLSLCFPAVNDCFHSYVP